MSLPPPILAADPLRPPPEHPGADPAADPILSGYGARDTEPAGEAAGLPVGPEEVTAVLVGLFDGLAQLRGPHWHAEPEEFAMAAPPIARELNKPDTTLAAWLAKHGDALLIVLGLGAVVVPRAYIEWRVMQLRRELARQQAAGEPPGGYAEPQPLYPDAGPYGPPAPPPPRGAGSDLREPGAVEAAPAIPTDPGRLAASVSSILGS